MDRTNIHIETALYKAAENIPTGNNINQPNISGFDFKSTDDEGLNITQTVYPGESLIFDIDRGLKGEQIPDGVRISIPSFLDSKDPTGFIEPENIGVSYNATSRKITLTHSSGVITYYWRGIKKQLTSPWESSAHNSDSVQKFLSSTDGDNFTWANDIWQFYDLQVAYITAGREFAIRECHGIMPNKVHELWHKNFGTTRKSGFGLVTGTFALKPANPSDADNTPSFEAGIISDEDIDSLIALWAEGTYTNLWFTASGTPNFLSTANSLLRVTGTYPNANIYNGTTFSDVEASTGKFLNYYVIRIPVTSDTESQKYRAVVLQPQNIHNSLAAAQSENIYSLYLGEFSNISPEFVFVERITFGLSASYTSIGKARIEAWSILTSSKVLNGIIPSSMIYPGAGIALSTGTAWGTPIVNNSANWNTAYGWGNHAGLYDKYLNWILQPENNAGVGSSNNITSGVAFNLKAGSGMDLSTDTSTPGVIKVTLTSTSGTNYWKRTGVILSPATANDRMELISNASTSEVLKVENTLSDGTAIYGKASGPLAAIKGENTNGIAVFGTTTTGHGIRGTATTGKGGYFWNTGTDPGIVAEKYTTIRNAGSDIVELFTSNSDVLGGQIGIGSNALFSVVNANNVRTILSRIGAFATSVTNAAESALFRLQLMRAGTVTIAMEISPTGIPYFNSRIKRVSGSDATTTGQSLVDITGLSIALEANYEYFFEADLQVSTSAVTTGTKYGVQFSAAGASVKASLFGSSTTAAMKSEMVTVLNTASGTYLTTSAQRGTIHIRGILTVGANAGNLTIRHLKVTSGTSTVFIGSTLMVERI